MTSRQSTPSVGHPRGVADLPALVMLAAAKYGPRVLALYDAREQLSYAELAGRMQRVCAGLADDRAPVGILTSRHADFVVGTLGALAAGRPAVLLDHRLPDDRVADVLARASVSTLVGDRSVERCTTRSLSDLLGFDPAEPLAADPNDLGTIIPTSGSTGSPKLVARRRQSDLLASFALRLSGFPLQAGHRFWLPIPVASSGFLSIVMGTLAVGASLIIEPFDASGANNVLETQEIDVAYFVPTMLRLCLASDGLQGVGWDQLRVLYWGGEVMDPQTAVVLAAKFSDRQWSGYGSTEAPLTALASPSDLVDAPGTSGRAAGLHAIRILDPVTKEPCPPGVEGEVVTSGADLFDGYLDGRGLIQPHGREYWTGDSGHLDESGRLFVSGRTSGFVNIGGNKVSPADVAATISRHPDVADAAVVAVEDPVWGWALHAFLLPRSGHALEPMSVIEWSRTKLAPASVPRRALVIAKFPLTATGKISIAELESIARS